MTKKKDKLELKTEQIVIRVTPEFRILLEGLALQSRRRLSDYVVRVLEDAEEAQKIV